MYIYIYIGTPTRLRAANPPPVVSLSAERPFADLVDQGPGQQRPGTAEGRFEDRVRGFQRVPVVDLKDVTSKRGVGKEVSSIVSEIRGSQIIFIKIRIAKPLKKNT